MFLQDLIYLIEQAGLGTYNVNLFKSSKSKPPPLPAPGPFITIIETGGAAPLGTHNSPNVPAYVRPSAQIVVRAIDYDVARNKAQAIYDMLFPIRNRVVNGTWWVSVRMVQEPFDLLPDEVGRPRVGFNIDVEKRLT